MEKSVHGGAALDVLLAAARLECACADAGSTAPALRALALRAAEFYLGLGCRPDRAIIDSAAQALPPAATSVRLAPLEGIRFYALDPAGYAWAARQWWKTQPARSAWVLGLRSMGSVLAPVAAAQLRAAGCTICWSTARPTGAPQDRRVRFDPALRCALRAWAGSFLVVDEGPGLSGSSFSGAVRALIALGIAPGRIALLAQWAPDATQCRRLVNAYAARHWHSWPVYAASPLPPPTEATFEISGGQWRDIFHGHCGVPVWPDHERRKFLSRDRRSFIKFAGFGAHGQATLERAQALASAGWGPGLAEPRLDHGWIFYQCERAAPLRGDLSGWCEFAGRYLAWVASEYVLGRHQSPSPQLRGMLHANLAWLAKRAAPPDPPPGPRIALDGRMLACEWGRTRRGLVKFDGTDHGDDPFFPGSADIAWDLAAIEVEFGRAPGAAVRRAYCRASGETAAALLPRLAWHRLAYAAFRSSFCRLAAAHTHAPDQQQFARLAQRYRRYLGGSPS